MADRTPSRGSCRPSTGCGSRTRSRPGPTLTFAGLDPRRLGFGDASAGLCGGMALTARDLYEAGVAAPADTAPPANGSPRFRALVRRQVAVARLVPRAAPLPRPPGVPAATRRPGSPRSLRPRAAAGRRASCASGRGIRAEIDARPPVGRRARSGSRGRSPWALTQNHQVLAYAYEETPEAITIHVYDPNHPNRDDVRLQVDILDAPGPAPGATGSGCTSRPASRCSASSASRTRRHARPAPGVPRSRGWPAAAAAARPSAGRHRSSTTPAGPRAVERRLARGQRSRRAGLVEHRQQVVDLVGPRQVGCTSSATAATSVRS